jgi:hypothetical protein
MKEDKRTEFIVGHFSGLIALMDMLHNSGLLASEECAEVLKDSYEVATDLLQVFQLADAITKAVDADMAGKKRLMEARQRDMLAKFRACVERLSCRVCGAMVVGEIKERVDKKLAEHRKFRRRHLKVVGEGEPETAS